jgi:hypothetical protein
MKKHEETPKITPRAGNYDLKTDAVETLVGADSATAPEYSREELERYRSKKGLRLPETVKVLLIKVWFYGAMCFFFLWGLGNYISAMLDMLFVLGTAMGMVTDLLLNNTLRFIEKTPGANDRWLMVTKKGTLGLVLNVLYGYGILLCVFMLYNLINYAIITVTGAEGTIPLGVEPILFGMFCVGFDSLFIGIKHLLCSIVQDAKNTASGR